VSYRPERLGEAIKEEVSDILRNELKDPRIGFATVTAVEVSGDLRHAKIFVSVLGSPEEQKATFEALRRAQGFVRSELGRRIRLRHTPEIVFRRDDSIKHGARVLELLEEVKHD
jgi:ribosome-binding factor A